MKDKGSKRIYVVDDDPDIGSILKKTLEYNGYQVSVYMSTELLLTRISKNIPDLLILDLKLPWEKGEDFLSRIKNIGQFEDIPVILISGKNLTGEDISELKMIGAIDFFSKPFDIQNLLKRMSEIIQ